MKTLQTTGAPLIDSICEKLKILVGKTMADKLEDEDSSEAFFEILNVFLSHLIIEKDNILASSKIERQSKDIVLKDQKIIKLKEEINKLKITEISSE